MKDITSLKNYSITDILRYYGTPTDNRGRFICPICKSGTHAHGTTAFRVYEGTNSYYCFSCQAGGDNINLIEQIEQCDPKTAIKKLENITGTPAPKTDRKIIIQPITSHQAETYEELETPFFKLSQQERQRLALKFYWTPTYDIEKANTEIKADFYLSSRGIKNPGEITRLYGVFLYGEKYKGLDTLTIRYKSFCTHRVLPPNDQNKRYLNEPGSKGLLLFTENLYYTFDNITPEFKDYCFICEGFFDAYSRLIAGTPALALNGAGNERRLLKILSQKKTDKFLILNLDDDQAGRIATEKLSKGLKDLNIKHSIFTAGGNYEQERR